MPMSYWRLPTQAKVMSGICLTEDELVQYTGYRRRAEQIRELSSRGIDFNVTPNRKLIVVRSHVEGKSAEEKYREEPNFDEI